MSITSQAETLGELLEFANNIAHPKAVKESLTAKDADNDAIGNILILGEAVLPGYVTHIISGKNLDRSENILKALRAENPFEDKLVLSWFKANWRTYPELSAYLVHLDNLRRMAIDVLEASGGMAQPGDKAMTEKQ